jgi:periplasmic divalent cation tolerance protein
MTDKIVVLSACSTFEEAHSIARKLIDARLAGCVNVIPGVRSFYRWKGAVEQAEEHILVIKSSRPQFAALRIELEKAHSYEIPEVVALPVVEGAPNYLNWLDNELVKTEV